MDKFPLGIFEVLSKVPLLELAFILCFTTTMSVKLIIFRINILVPSTEIMFLLHVFHYIGKGLVFCQKDSSQFLLISIPWKFLSTFHSYVWYCIVVRGLV